MGIVISFLLDSLHLETITQTAIQAPYPPYWKGHAPHDQNASRQHQKGIRPPARVASKTLRPTDASSDPFVQTTKAPREARWSDSPTSPFCISAYVAVPRQANHDFSSLVILLSFRVAVHKQSILCQCILITFLSFSYTTPRLNPSQNIGITDHPLLRPNTY